jgi:hypothetical protein
VPQARDRCGPRQAVGGQAERPLEVPQGRVGHRAEDSVDRPGRIPAAGEDVLHRGHVPATIAALHGAAAESGTAALAEGAPGLGTHHTVNGKAAAALEAHDRRLRHGAANAVHGRVVETDSFQGNLNGRDLGAGERRGG